jgi:cytochrome c-type biogenesis protein CcmH
MLKGLTTSHSTLANVALAVAASAALVAAGIAVSRSNDALPTRADPHADLAIGEPLGDVDTMMARLEFRLKGDPSDVAGWRMLGWSRMQTGRPADAVAAYGRAVALTPGDAATWSALGEAQLANANVADARTAFARALAIDPVDPTARFSLAVMKAQSGNRRGAVEDMLAMLETAPPGAEWAADVRAKASSVAREAGMDIGARLDKVAPPDLVSASGPSAQQVAAASALPVGEQQAMIDGMVARLDARLADHPRDLEGWARLMRARMVLGQGDAAAVALQAGLAAFADDAAAQARLRAEAKALEVPR